MPENTEDQSVESLELKLRQGVSERMKVFFKQLDIPIYKFCETTLIQPTTAYKYADPENNHDIPTPFELALIAEKYPETDVDYILFGFVDLNKIEETELQFRKSIAKRVSSFFKRLIIPISRFAEITSIDLAVAYKYANTSNQHEIPTILELLTISENFPEFDINFILFGVVNEDKIKEEIYSRHFRRIDSVIKELQSEISKV